MDESTKTTQSGERRLMDAAFKSEMARRRAVGSLRNVRRCMGALIQVLVQMGVTPSNNVYLKEAIGANVVSYTQSEQTEEDSDTLAAIAALENRNA